MTPDIAASLSGSSSATSGLSNTFRNIFGDHTVGRKPTPPWIYAAIAAAILVGFVIWQVRR